MAKLSFICFIFLIGIAPASLTPPALAQHPDRGTSIGNEAAANTPTFEDVAFNADQPPYMGSIGGRVFNESESAKKELSGIAGVRVILRSVDAATDEILGNTLSDPAGRYEFQGLRPGKYAIELDPISLPARYQATESGRAAINVEPARRSSVDLAIRAQRTVTGVVFIDIDNDGQFDPGKDQPVEGALVTVDGNLAVSNADGRYVLRNLPSGRIGLLVAWPKASQSTHVILDLAAGPVMGRVVNVSRSR